MRKIILTAVVATIAATVAFSQNTPKSFPANPDISGMMIIYNQSARSSNMSAMIGFVNNARGSHSGAQIGLANFTARGESGLQAGIYNQVGGIVTSGVQIGVANLVTGPVHGPQFGVANVVAKGGIIGPQFGVSNIVVGAMNGPQFGVLNVVTNGIRGPQFGVANIVVGNIRGPQFGVLNAVDGNAYSSQFGVANLTSSNVSGVQVGVLNHAKRVYRLQLGVVNITESLGQGGLPIGLLNITRHGGYQSIEVGSDGMFPVRVAIKTGVRKFYSSIIGGYDPEFRDQFAIGAGVGTILEIKGSFFFSPEVNIVSTVSEHSATILEAHPNVGLEFSRHFSVVVAPTFAWQRAEGGRLNDPQWSIYNHEINSRNAIYVGARVALRYAFDW